MKSVEEKAKSKAQQRLFGMARAVQKGKMKAPSKTVASIAKGVEPKEVEKFAKTKHKGLPEKVKKENAVIEQVSKVVKKWRDIVGCKRSKTT